MSSQTLENDPREEKTVTLFDQEKKLTRYGDPNKKPSKNEWYLPDWINVQQGIPKTFAGVFRVNIKPDKSTINRINDRNYKIKDADGKWRKLRQPDADGKSLEDLVNLTVQLKRGTYENDLGAFDTSDFLKEEIFKNKNEVSKWLRVASWFGLWDMANMQKGKRKLPDFRLQKPTGTGVHLAKSEKLADKKTKEFLNFPSIKNWIDSGFVTGETNQKRLFKAMKIMNTTPAKFLGLDQPSKTKEEKKADRKILLAKLKLWTENPNAKNPAHTTGERTLQRKFRFAPKAKIEGRDPDTLDRFSVDVNPPIEEKDSKPTKYAEKGWKKGQTLISDRNNSTMYQFVKDIRNFMTANDIVTPKGQAKVDDPIGTGASLLSQQVVGAGQYPKIQLTEEEIREMYFCLKDGAKKEISKFKLEDRGKFEKIGGDYDFTNRKDKWSVKSFWDDAFFLFWLSVQALGGRAEELFTIIAGDPKDDDSSGVTITADDAYVVGIYTRKTERTKADMIHEGLIPDSPDGQIIKDLIDKRHKEIKNRKDVIEDKQSNPELNHSLIGGDGKYVRVDTLNLPSGQVVKTNRQKIIRNILRYCYQSVGVEQSYFYDRPIHALRHAMAKYWLTQSDYDYSLVMKMGHWSNLELLQDSYGGINNAELLAKINRVANKRAITDKLPVQKPMTKDTPLSKVLSGMNQKVTGKEKVFNKKEKAEFEIVDEEILPTGEQN